MRKLFALSALFVLFLLLDAVGGIAYHPFGVTTMLSSSALTRRMFFWDGLLFMVIAYLLLCVLAALRKRLGWFAPTATIALVLAAIAGYLLKLGFVTHDL